MGTLRTLFSVSILLMKVMFRVDKRALRMFLSSLDPFSVRLLAKLVNELGPDRVAQLLTNYFYFSAAMHKKISTFLTPELLDEIHVDDGMREGIEKLSKMNPEVLQALGAMTGLIVGRFLRRVLEDEEVRKNLSELIKNLGLLWEETYRLPNK